MSQDQRQAWFARVMESGLEHQIFQPSDVLQHATPDVLASHLPPELLSKILAASLAAGKMTPEHVLETVTRDGCGDARPQNIVRQVLRQQPSRVPAWWRREHQELLRHDAL